MAGKKKSGNLLLYEIVLCSQEIRKADFSHTKSIASLLPEIIPNLEFYVIFLTVQS